MAGEGLFQSSEQFSIDHYCNGRSDDDLLDDIGHSQIFRTSIISSLVLALYDHGVLRMNSSLILTSEPAVVNSAYD
jgi:hypothetical protein